VPTVQATPTQTHAPTWRLQDAKSQFSTLVDLALRGVPQHVTRRGKQAVVVLSEQDFVALQRGGADPSDRPVSLISHLLAMPKMPGDDADGLAEVSALEIKPRDVDFS
jgi:antitoxin Phd